MAVYSGSYYCDGGLEQRQVNLTVFGVNVIEGRETNLRGDRFETDSNFDALYLPKVFIDHVLPVRGCGSVPINGLRHVKAFYANSLYLTIPCPFAGGTITFQQFMQELTNNRRLILVELHGETVGFNLRTLLRN